MSEFLRQAYRNNWQLYLTSLQPHARGVWDACVLTASDERQASMYRRQLDWRREAGLLPKRTRFEVFPDPGGRRIGSGGATLRVLQDLASRPASTRPQRVLLIHSGGDSRRLPHASATGKLFARVPRVLPDGRASTIFDEFLIGLSGLPRGLPPGVLVASGDVLLIFDPLQLSFQRRGVTGVAAAAAAEMGTHHGVYVSGDTGHRVRAFLHKPPQRELARRNAIRNDGTVQIDTGLVWLDAETASAFTEVPREGAPAGLEPGHALNLYGDLLLPLADATTLDGYLADTSDGPATPEIRTARRAIWDRLRGTPFTVERLQPAVFVHFGTSREYWQTAAGDAALAQMCGWTAQAGAWLGGSPGGEGGRLALVNAALEGEVTVASSPALVVDSHLRGPLAWEGGGIVAGLHTTRPLRLAADAVIHQLPVEGGFVTRVFGLNDDPKQVWDGPSATFMNRPWSQWLSEAGLDPEVVWPDHQPPDWTLWNARLYPVAADREESLRLALPLMDAKRASADWRAQWRDTLRLSLAESFLRADGERLLSDLAAVEDTVAGRRFYAAVEAEQAASGAKEILGTEARVVRRRGRQVGRWLADASPVLRLRGYKALADATGQAAWEDRAFATLAEMIEAAVRRTRPRASREEGRGRFGAFGDDAVRVEAAARIDFGGGWTDTPPYSVERGGTVLNAAVTLRNAYPIAAEGERLAGAGLILESRDIEAALEPTKAGELLTYANPADPFALHKAALVLCGIVPQDCDPDVPVQDLLQDWGGGLRLSTQTSIPRGSGLGTSSIMAGAVLACIGRMMGVVPTQDALFDEVLCLEQMLTTGGGWQDQVGGLTGGIKLVTTRPGLPQQIRTDSVHLAPETEAELMERLVLVYTGQQRLARDLLRSVMGRWMARDAEMARILSEIAQLAVGMQAALISGDVDGFGRLLGEHWAQNKRMDPGCSNPFIDGLFEVMAPYICGGKLAGAGGGGFAAVVARDGEAARDLSSALTARYPGTPVAVWECGIPKVGLVKSKGAKGDAYTGET